MDLVRPLALAGIRSAVVSRPGTPPLYSRFTATSCAWADFSERADELVDALVSFGAAQPAPPVLFYEEDAQLLLVSRHRERLSRAFRFVVGDPVLVEDLVDKARFQVLAERLDLPVPRTRRVRPAEGGGASDLGLRFPLIVKPLTRQKPWDEIGGTSKAIEVPDLAALRALWPRLVAVGMEILAQELVPGPETRIESYHVYVDGTGAIAGEFTGRKIRTYPEAYGHSTALEITDARDVRDQGRDFVARLNLTGIAKFDFKRGPDGALHLLEINPRFNLWHHLGAVAGVNLPALVHADLTGGRRPSVAPARVGTRWCSIWNDYPAARAQGVPLARWLPWALGCEAKSALSWDDPMPLLRSLASRAAAGRNGRAPEGGALQPVWS